MESWRKVFREGFAPLLSTEQLTALREALLTDDVRLLQGATSSPPPMMAVQYWPAEAGCALGFCGIIANGGFGKATVGEAEEFFARACFDADQRLGEPAACRYFLCWADETPRSEMRLALLPEVELALSGREDAPQLVRAKGA